MRKALLFLWISLLISSTPAFSQQSVPAAKGDAELVGLWQIGTNVVGAGLNDNWRFFRDGRFTFNLRGTGLNPLRSISGTYYVDEKGLHLKVAQFKALTGYKVAGTDPGAEFGHFRLEDGKEGTINQNDTEFSFHWFKILTPKSLVEIDGDKYYRVSADPNKEP